MAKTILHVQGGRGDVVCAEPVFRYTIDYVLPEDEIVISSYAPDFFTHLASNRVKVVNHNDLMNNIDEYSDYRTLCAYQNETRPGRGMMQAVTHGVDYASFYTLGYILPTEHRRCRLPAVSEEEKELARKVFKEQYDLDIEETLLIHPGCTWETRTIPVEWWEKFVKHYDGPVCVIGQESARPLKFKTKKDKEGYSPSLLPIDGVPRFTNNLTMRGLIVAISQAWGLITNDSLPVHIAGAFDNRLFTFATVKHWDTLRPYGHPLSYDFAIETVLKPYHYASTKNDIRFDLFPEGVTSLMDFIRKPRDVARTLNAMRWHRQYVRNK